VTHDIPRKKADVAVGAYSPTLLELCIPYDMYSVGRWHIGILPIPFPYMHRDGHIVYSYLSQGTVCP